MANTEDLEQQAFNAPVYYENQNVALENMTGSELMARMASDNNLYIPSTRPLESKDSLTPKKPGFFETIGHYAYEESTALNAVEWINEKLEARNYANDQSEEGWTVYQTKYFENIDQKYWPYIAGAPNDTDAQRRRDMAMEKMERNRYFQNAGWIPSLIGGIVGGAALSPEMLIPFAGGVRAAKASEGILKQTMRHAPEITAGNIAHNALIQSEQMGGNLEEFALNTFRDEVFGLGLLGAGMGIKKAWNGGAIYDARRVLNIQQEGEIITDVADGKASLKFEPNMPMSAARVDEYTSFLNSQMTKEGAFRAPWVQKAFKGISPAINMLNHSYTTVSEVFNNMFTHTLRTKGMQEGAAQTFSMELLLGNERSKSILLTNEINGLFYEANGIKGGSTAANGMKMLKQRIGDGLPISKLDFSRRVREVFATGAIDDNKAINTAAELIDKRFAEIYKGWLKANDFEEDILPLSTAKSYFMRNYDHDALRTNEALWNETIVRALREQDERITALHQPVRELEQEIVRLEERIKTNPSNIPELENTLRQVRYELAAAEDTHRGQLDLHENHILLEDRSYLTQSQEKELKGLLQDRTNIEQELEEIKRQGQQLSEQSKKLNTAIKKARKTGDDRTELKKELENLKAEMDANNLAKEIKSDELREEIDRLRDMVERGEIDRNLYLRNARGGFRQFKDPYKTPKLRKTYKSDEERYKAASAYRDRILGNTPEQIYQDLMGSMLPGIAENPTMARSLMIPDKDLIPFFTHDINQSLMTYTNFFTRKTLMKERFPEWNEHEGVMSIADLLNREREGKTFELKRKSMQMTKAQFDKELKQIDKDFDKAKKDLNQMLDVWFGKRRNTAFQQALRNWAIVTKLGNVPIAMLTDLAGMIYKTGFWNFIRDGLIPGIKDLNFLSKERATSDFRMGAADALVAHENIITGINSRYWDSQSMSDIPVIGALPSALQKLTERSGNIFATNYVQNMFERMAANIAQSKIMRDLNSFKNGTINQKGRDFLLLYGIQPEKWSETMIRQMEQAGGGKHSLGGYNSKFYDWADNDAQYVMSLAVRKATQDMVIKKGMMDAPGWSYSEYGKFFTMFQGYAFAAFNRFSAPLMQKPDVEKVIGLLTALSIGAMIDPLRKLAKGEEFKYDDDDNWFVEAAYNSGMFGYPVEAIQQLNAILHGELLSGVYNEKYKDRTVAGLLGGPVGGLGQDSADTISMILSGQFSKPGVKKAVNLIPYANAWYLRYPVNTFLKSTSLPDTKSEAQRWSWRGD